MFEQTFKNIDDCLWKDAGCGSELDYVEQTSWVLFLKYLDDLERDRAAEAELTGEAFQPLFPPEFRWGAWAAPKTADGEPDLDARTGDDLIAFVNGELFPFLASFRETAEGTDTIEYKVGQIFSEVKNKVQSGYTLREVLGLVDELQFQTSEQKHELSHLYESKIKNMGNAGRNGGEYYTPRPLIRSIVRVIDPQIGETVYDGACGSAGFLVEAFDHMRTRKERGGKQLTVKERRALQSSTLYGQEKKSLPFVMGTMNLILHGVEAPNLVHANTLTENVLDIQEGDRVDVVLANPPFGGKERKEVQQNFPIKTGETAFLFLQHFIRKLRAGGRAAVVIKNTFLSNGDNAAVSLRKELLESCDLHTVLDLPGGTFTGAGVKTVVLFFEKGRPTRRVWYYQLAPGRNLGKTNPLTEEDLAEFERLQPDRADSEQSWSVPVEEVDPQTWDLSVKNPNAEEEEPLRSPAEILDEIERLDREAAEVLGRLRELVG